MLQSRTSGNRMLHLLRKPAVSLHRIGRSARAIGYKVGTDRDNYVVPAQAKNDFHRDGYVVLRGLLTEEEVKAIETIYNKVMQREINIPGKDFCDMSKSFDTPFENFSIINAMLPRRYFPPLAGNIYEQRAQRISKQLYGGTDMVRIRRARATSKYSTSCYMPHINSVVHRCKSYRFTTTTNSLISDRAKRMQSLLGIRWIIEAMRMTH